MKRPQFLSIAAAAAAICAPATAAPNRSVSLEIRNVAWTVRPGFIVDIVAYNGVVPGPPLRVTEGDRLSVTVHNRTTSLQSIHWHGLVVSDRVDGVIELGSPAVPVNGSRTYEFTATPGGTRWYHAHTAEGLFSGMFAPLIVDRRREPGNYDREVVLLLHEFGERIETLPPMAAAPAEAATLVDPATNRGGGMMGGGMMGGGMMGMMGPTAVARYGAYAVNGKALGAGEPIRVRTGERVRLRVINASATLTHRLALPGHRFLVTEFDGNAVPRPRLLDAIELGVSERIDAIVEMNAPGVWVLGSTDPYARSKGLGIVVAYNGRRGSPQWRDTDRDAFAYGRFADASRTVRADAVFDFRLEKSPNGPDRWMINGEEFPDVHPLDVQRGKTYLLRFANASTMEHPIHTHGHSFELASIDGIPMSGVIKDTIVVRPMGGRAELILRADNPYGGRYLLHCHNEQHMDGGMATVISYRTS